MAGYAILQHQVVLCESVLLTHDDDVQVGQVERVGSKQPKLREMVHLQRLSSSLSYHEVTGVPTMLVLHWIRVHKCQLHSRSLQFLLMSLSNLFRVFSETSLVCPAASSY